MAKKIIQEIKGNNNIQVGVHTGDIVNSKKNIIRPNVIYEPDLHISESEALTVKNKIDEYVKMLASDGSQASKYYPMVYKEIYNTFKVTSYKTIPKDKLNEVLLFLQKKIAYIGRKKVRKHDNTDWKKQMYTAINARSRTLGMNKKDLYLYASDYLGIKEPITSLKEISDTRLKKLYTKIFSEKR